jgi:hypothetical protein
MREDQNSTYDEGSALGKGESNSPEDKEDKETYIRKMFYKCWTRHFCLFDVRVISFHAFGKKSSPPERPEEDVSRNCNKSLVSISRYLSGVFNFLSSGTTLFKTHMIRYEFHDHPCLKNPCYAASHAFTGHKKTKEC